MPTNVIAAEFALIKTALSVAKSYPVFPTSDKVPSWTNRELGVERGQGGYKIATQDPTEVKRLFSHQRAAEIAVPMGEMSGLLCVDVDLHKDPELEAWVAENDWMANTLTHKTRSGGLHFFFRHEPGVFWPSTLREGVDVKAGGNGYVCWPGTPGYSVLVDVEPAVFPLDVLEEIMVARGGTGLLSGPDTYNNATDDELMSRIQEATDLYPSLRSLSMRMASSRISPDETIATLKAIMDMSVASDPDHPRHLDWVDRRSKIEHLVVTAVEKAGAAFSVDDDFAKALDDDGPSFLDTQRMLAASSRPIGPQQAPTADEISALAAEIELDEDEFHSVTLGELHQRTIEPVEWLVPGIIPKMNSGALAGSSNVGKTRWLALLAACVASGRTDILGWEPCEPTSVVWLANEEYVEDILRRIKAVALHYDLEDSEPIIVRGKAVGSFKLAQLNETRVLEINRDNVSRLTAMIDKVGAGLVLLDPYVTLADAMDGGENSSSTAETVREALTLVQSSPKKGVATIFAHHTPKANKKEGYRGDLEALRGSGAIGAALDFSWTMDQWTPPKGSADAAAWKQHYLRLRLKRFVVVDNAKVREGEGHPAIVMELVGQEMGEGEGRDIGVCRISSEAEALDALSVANDEDATFSLILDELIDNFGEGRVSGVKNICDPMKDVPGWPPYKNKVQGELAKLFERLSSPTRRGDYEITILRDAGGWQLRIVKMEDTISM